MDLAYQAPSYLWSRLGSYICDSGSRAEALASVFIGCYALAFNLQISLHPVQYPLQILAACHISAFGALSKVKPYA